MVVQVHALHNSRNHHKLLTGRNPKAIILILAPNKFEERGGGEKKPLSLYQRSDHLFPT